MSLAKKHVRDLGDTLILDKEPLTSDRRRESAMPCFRRMRSLQKFVAVHSSVHNHFNQERHLYSRGNFKFNRAAALAEWR